MQLLDKYQQYVGRRNYADVPTVSEYMPRNSPSVSQKQQQFVDSFPYGEVVGSLLYLAVVTRIDIMHAVAVLTRHLKSPTYASCKAACRVLNYLSNNRSNAIRYHGSALDLHVFTDSDWASDKDTRKSTSGNIVFRGGGPIDWLSKLQPIITVSSMEAEYIACYFAVQVIVWIRQVLRDLSLTRTKPTRVYIDTMSAAQLATNPVHHQRSKHIDIKYHWLREQSSAQTVLLVHTPTKDQRADFLTKHIRGPDFHRHVSGIMYI